MRFPTVVGNFPFINWFNLSYSSRRHPLPNFFRTWNHTTYAIETKHMLLNASKNVFLLLK